MTLRHRLGGEVRGLFGHVNDLLDSKDALIVLFDGQRLVSFAHGFAASPSQLELLGIEIERSARSAAGGVALHGSERRSHEEGNTITGSGNGAGGTRRHSGDDDRHGRRGDSRTPDIGRHDARRSDSASRGRGRDAGRVLQLARDIA
jgi:hypothetical protein